MLHLQVGSVFTTSDADLGADLDPDHRLLLRFVQTASHMSVSILYGCRARARPGSYRRVAVPALVTVRGASLRILRNRREIQFVVLDAIR